MQERNFGPLTLGAINPCFSIWFARPSYVRSRLSEFGVIAGYDFGPAWLQTCAIRDMAHLGPGGPHGSVLARVENGMVVLTSRVVER